jgi:transglutaminase-like putative cysteine protease
MKANKIVAATLSVFETHQHTGDGSMQRRDFIKNVAAAGIIGTVGRRARAAEMGWRQFEITYRINIKGSDSDTDVRLWVPVPQDALDYQRVLDLSWRSPVATHVLWEATSRAPIVSATWMDPKIAREIVITAQVATRDRLGFYPDASHDELAEYLKPTASSPNDGIVLAKAREIVGARIAPLDKARAIYDWIVDNTFRRAETRGCGLGNIAFMLEAGDLGGKCADINSLFVGLARAAGLPARDFSEWQTRH